MSDSEVVVDDVLGEDEVETLGEIGLWTGSKSQTDGLVANVSSKTQAVGSDDAPRVSAVNTETGVNAHSKLVQSRTDSRAAGMGIKRQSVTVATSPQSLTSQGVSTSEVNKPEPEKAEEIVEAEMVEIDPDSDKTELDGTAETQTRGESLSFEDPRLFELAPDEIIDETLQWEARLSYSNRDLGGQEEYELGFQPPAETPLEELGEIDDDDGETEQPEYPEKDEEDQEEDAAKEEFDAIQIEEQSSLKDFEDVYMKPSHSCAMGRLSADIMAVESRCATPSPPGTPSDSPRINKCPSIESFFKLSDLVEVNLHILPGQKIYGKNIRLDRTIAVIKEELSRLTKVPAKFLELRRDKNLVMDYKTLKDVGAKPGKKMKFTVELSRKAAGKYQLRIPEKNQVDTRPELIRSVQVPTEQGFRTVKVTIEFSSERKLFIGGYKHKKTGIECHHAYTQTMMGPKKHRDNVTDKACQPFREKTTGVQTVVTTYTQVDRPDYYVSRRQQRLICPRRYVSAAQVERLRVRAAIIIQAYWRRWLAIRERESRMQGLIKRVEWAEAVRKGKTEIRLAIKDDEMFREYNPQTLNDLELLYRAINVWRKEKVDYIIANRWGAEKKAALADIVEKESDLLLDLERRRNKILEQRSANEVRDLFMQMGSPSRWLTRTGHFVSVDTPGKAGARALKEIYEQLAEPVADPMKRFELLQKIYELGSFFRVKDHRNVMSEYLIQLMGREITLMQRYARKGLLVGLRKRILNSFFALCREPSFNPEAKILQMIPFDNIKLRKDMVQCKSCRRMLYRDQFTISRGTTVTSRCLRCIGLYRRCIIRADMNLYRRMLQELRYEEQEQGVDSSVTYVIDAFDLQFLIEDIWHGQSALSGINDRYLLRLCRWLKNQPWTPWNCVLLTEEESVAHLLIEDMKKAYQQPFFDKVRLRHNAARGYFQRNAKIALGLDPSLKDQCLDWNAARNEMKKKTIRRR